MASTPLCRDGRDNHLDAFRLAFALLVLFSHSWPLALGDSRGEPLAVMSSRQITAGTLAVDAFFAISGLLVTASWDRSRGALDFLRRRALRIYPGFLACCVLCAMAIGPAFAPSASGYFRSFGSRRAFAQNLLTFQYPTSLVTFEHNPFPMAVNGSLWTIRYEFLCYLMVLALGACRLLRRPVVAALFLAAFAWQVLYDVNHQVYRHLTDVGVFGRHLDILGFPIGFPSQWARLLTYFLAGSTFWLYRASVPRSGRLALGCALALGAGLLVPPMFVWLLPSCGTYLLFYAAYAPAEARPARPDFSYGIYLYAWPVQQAVAASIPGIAPLAVFAVASAITLVFAAASWYLIESPCLRSRWFGGRSSPAGAGPSITDPSSTGSSRSSRS